MALPGTDRSGRTPLHQAALEADVRAVRSFLARGEDVAAVDADGRTALHFAAQSQALEAARALIEAGAPVNGRDRFGNGPLWTATFNSRGEGAVIETLLFTGADPDAANDAGASPRQLATNIANFDIARFFADL